jgi:nitroreductase
VDGRSSQEAKPVNQTVDVIMRRSSVRAYKPDEPSAEVVEAVVRAGQQAPFAAQLGSVILRRDPQRNPFGAPLLFTICADVHRLECVLAERGWRRATSDAAILLFAVQDAAYMAENMVLAGEALGLGSCYIGGAAFAAAELVAEYALPPRVFPFVQLAMGYPVAPSLPRPRYPVSFTLHEERYREPSAANVREAMAAMDEGYLAQDYYRDYVIPLEEGRRETFSRSTYSWTEHMGRKWGQWLRDPAELLEPLRACGFDLGSPAPAHESESPSA